MLWGKVRIVELGESVRWVSGDQPLNPHWPEVADEKPCLPELQLEPQAQAELKPLRKQVCCCWMRQRQRVVGKSS